MSTVRTMATLDDTAKVASVKRRGITGKLVTVPHIAEMLNVTRQTALSMSQNWGFPVPIDVINPDTRPLAIWWRKDIEKWIAANPEVVRPAKEKRDG